MRDLHALVQTDYAYVMAETDHASRTLKTIGESHKIIIAPSGNMVEQLYIYIVIQTKYDLA